MSEEFNVFPKTTARAKNLNIVDTIQHFSKGSIIAFVLTDKDGVWIFLIFIDSSLGYRIILIVQSFASQFRQIKTSLTRSGMYGPKAFFIVCMRLSPKAMNHSNNDTNSGHNCYSELALSFESVEKILWWDHSIKVIEQYLSSVLCMCCTI